MNLPNKLSLARIILVPFILLFMLPIHIGSFAPEGWNNFVCENGMIVAAILFVVASLTDLLDGKIASGRSFKLDRYAKGSLVGGIHAGFVPVQMEDEGELVPHDIQFSGPVSGLGVRGHRGINQQEREGEKSLHKRACFRLSLAKIVIIY